MARADAAADGAPPAGTPGARPVRAGSAPDAGARWRSVRTSPSAMTFVSWMAPAQALARRAEPRRTAVREKRDPCDRRDIEPAR